MKYQLTYYPDHDQDPDTIPDPIPIVFDNYSEAKEHAIAADLDPADWSIESIER